MLIGSYNHVVDDKGRLFIPAKFRDELGEEFFVARGIEECIMVYSESEWGALAQKLRNIPFSNADAQRVRRFIMSEGESREPDKQGRISLPPKLRKYASIDKEAIIIGMDDHVEIWSKEKWDAYNAHSNMDFGHALDALRELGI